MPSEFEQWYTFHTRREAIELEHWIPTIPLLLAIAGLWWKLTTSVATKEDIKELKADMREIRQMLFTHVGDREKHS